MARAEAASASARADSIKGLAQSIANPAYRRLLTAEPALRRAVPALIIAFLLTIGVGAVVQVLDHHRQAIAEATHDIDNVADFVSERFDRLASGFAFDAPNPIEPSVLANYARNPIPELPVSQFRVRGGGKRIVVRKPRFEPWIEGRKGLVVRAERES